MRKRVYIAYTGGTSTFILSAEGGVGGSEGSTVAQRYRGYCDGPAATPEILRGAVRRSG